MHRTEARQILDKTQFLDKVVQSVWFTAVSSMKLNSVCYRFQRTLTNSLYIFVKIAQRYAGLFQVIVTIEHCDCNLYSGISQMQNQKSQ